MTTRRARVALAVLAVLAVAVAGCGSPPAKHPKPAAPPATQASPSPAQLAAPTQTSPCVVPTGTGRMGVCVPHVLGLTQTTPVKVGGQFGVDISSYQGCPALHGISFAIFKAGEGNFGQDSTYACHVNAARAAHLPFGAYWFQRPGDQVGQARQFVQIIRSRGPPSIPPTIDSEVGVSASATCTFTSELHRLGYPVVIVYTSPGLWPGGPSCGAKLWVADYASRPVNASSWTGHVAWQFTGDGLGPSPHSLPGIGSNIDIDLATGILSLVPHPKPCAKACQDRFHLGRLYIERRSIRARLPGMRRTLASLEARGNAVNRAIRALGAR